MGKVRDQLSPRLVSYAIEAQHVASREPRLAAAIHHVATSALSVLSSLEVFADACEIASVSPSVDVDGGTRKRIRELFSAIPSDMRDTISELREHFEVLSVMGCEASKEGSRIRQIAAAHGIDTCPLALDRVDEDKSRVVEMTPLAGRRRKSAANAPKTNTE
jgi:hypothetical protein